MGLEDGRAGDRAAADGDQIGVIQTISNIFATPGAGIDVRTLLVVDKAKISRGLQLLFFSSAVTVAADNAAVDVSDTDMAAYYVGQINIAAADYATLAANSSVTEQDLGLILRGTGVSRNLYYVVVCRDASGCDYANIGDLSFKFLYYN